MVGAFRKALLGTTLTASAILAGHAQAGEIRGRITGPDGKPVVRAQVVVEDLRRGNATGKDGSFTIKAVPGGPIHVSIIAPGLEAVFPTVQVPENGVAELNVTLARSDLIKRSAALNAEPKSEHDAQKAAYLQSIRKVTGKTPNVLLILFDDLGYGDYSSFGNQLIKTPNIDAYGRKGMRLNDFYAASPVCSPSRASIMTGRYPMHTNMATHVLMATGSDDADYRRSRGLANAIPSDEILLPEVLSRAGYRTGLFGKWHLGDTPGHIPNDMGFQDFFGLLYPNDTQPTNLWRNKTIVVPADRFDQTTITERIADETIAFIRKNADKPFFAFASFTAPHRPHFANPKHQGVSDGGTYGDVIEDLDANVGRISDVLRELKLDENTIVIVTSDNGGDFEGNVGNLRGRKGDTFEGGMRVPTFIAWPGHIAPGSSSDEMAGVIDLFPTILAAVKQPLPADRVIDGRDITPILSGGQTPHDYLYYTTSWSGQYEAVRNSAFKLRDPASDTDLIARQRATGGQGGLYDLARDNESHDVTARHPEVRTELQQALDHFRADEKSNVRGWTQVEH
ncbi:sulfatase-like hydrolase/transferase [Novosphingobium sp. PhB165]|uniref:sulfatase-like hydrolase/transferase n=1 Tax=Novosphingobium sp. PhB165 TaxID=2485105 RepID=UPI001A9CF8FB|nr:sulfatase-like hydrolase/transferase [Novosphingobium sp. PhB165]